MNAQTFWITKYALSGGIFTIESEAKHENFMKADQLWVADTRPRAYGHFWLGKDAFSSETAALANAEQRRAAKIASLEKQIAKLRKTTFKVKAPAAEECKAPAMDPYLRQILDRPTT